MEQDFLFNQKKVIAKNTLDMKVKVHGFRCEVEIPTSLNTVYGEESGHINYIPIHSPSKVLVSNTTQENMKAYHNPLNSTENQNIYLVMFEDDILPRNSRIKIYMQDDSYRQLQVRDNIKNEGTFIIHQELVPCINTVDNTDPDIGENISCLEDSNTESTNTESTNTESTNTESTNTESTNIGENL